MHDRAWHVHRRAGQLRIHHGRGPDRPQYAALHLDSSYLRLTHAPTAGWGTSLILLPSFWTGGRLRQGAPVTATWRPDGPDLRLTLAGTIARLAVAIDLRLLAPSPAGLTAHVAADATGSVRLDDRPGEAFKPVTLASMRVSPTHWDAASARVDGRDLPIPPRGWIAPPGPPARTLALRGGSSTWKRDAPTLAVALDRPMAWAGWVTASRDPNDDNVGLWAADDRALPAWSYTVTARAD